MAGSSDNDLLARLNALKPSTIDLDRTASASHMPATDDGDDIARRFLGLRSRSDFTSTGRGSTEASEAAEQDEVEDIDEMLKELRAKEKTSLAPDDAKRVQILLAQAQNALDGSDDENDGTDGRGLKGTGKAEESEKGGDHEVHESKDAEDDDSDIDEDAEADELLAQILAEVKLNMNREQEEGSAASAEVGHSIEEVQEPQAFDEALFPTTPSKEPVLPKVPASNDLQLPSAPTSAPARPGPRSGLKNYTDAEIETWCEICQANAEVRCLGCDGELYCLRCWKEGHTGPDAGYEEKSHRCVQYSKPGPQPAAA